ncbi:odorant receptor 22c-like [Fopius arisanus]|uniref:Odorant receptor n=1 Tax=Fopius arisanus TaxID=64838 RepID=A0A9R1T0Z4_9HYME|nr:PREDICTED: odorant receptor 22c-like [Fopius arisanus]
MRIDFEYSCGWNRLVMDSFGLWPKCHMNFIEKNWSLIIAIMISIVVIIPRFAAIFLFWNETDAVVQSFSTQLLFMTIVFKLLILHFRNEVLADLLTAMEADLSQRLTDIKYLAVLRTARIGRIISIVLTSGTFCILITGVIATKFYHLDSLYIKNPDPRLSLNFFWVTYLPFSTENTISYVTVLSLQLLASLMAGFYFIFDGFVVMLILHVCGQLQLIQISLQHLVDNLPLIRDLRVTLRKIMEHHQRMHRFVSSIDQCFNMMWFLELTSCTLTFCFQGYILLKLLRADQSSTFQMSFPVCAAIGLLSKFFLNCWAGEYLISQSSEIGSAFYEAQWYKLVPSDARSLMMIGHKKIRPFTLSTAKFSVLSFRLFVQMLKTSGSYLSMLLVVAES